MAQWRKVVVSGSSAVLNQVSASGNIVPKTTDGSSLGTSTLQFSDLFLGEGAVINWDGGDFTATQTNNLLALSGGNTRVDRLEVDSANDYLDVDTDLKIVAAADITLDPGGNNVKPGGDSADDLGVSGTAWRTLYVDAIEMNGQGAIAGVTHVTASGNISGSAASSGSFGYLKVSGDGVFGGDITFGDANTDSVSFGADISSDLIPNADDTYDLGSASQAWQDLFLEGDITLTDAGKLVSSAGNLTVDSEAATLVLDGHTGVDIDASNSGKVSIDGAGGIDIGVAADVAIDIDSAALDIDASGAITIDGTSTFSLDAAGNTNIDTSTGTISVGTANSGIAVNIGHSTSEVTIGDNLTVNGDAAFTGDLTVNGTTTFISSSQLDIGDNIDQVNAVSPVRYGGLQVNDVNAIE